jgi:hypothetical protein
MLKIDGASRIKNILKWKIDLLDESYIIDF